MTPVMSESRESSMNWFIQLLPLCFRCLFCNIESVLRLFFHSKVLLSMIANNSSIFVTIRFCSASGGSGV